MPGCCEICFDEMAGYRPTKYAMSDPDTFAYGGQNDVDLLTVFGHTLVKFWIQVRKGKNQVMLEDSQKRQVLQWVFGGAPWPKIFREEADGVH